MVQGSSSDPLTDGSDSTTSDYFRPILSNGTSLCVGERGQRYYLGAGVVDTFPRIAAYHRIQGGSRPTGLDPSEEDGGTDPGCAYLLAPS